MFPIQLRLVAGLALLSLLILTSAGGSGSAQQPKGGEVKRQAQPAQGRGPRPFQVLYDRRVGFPLRAMTFSRDGKLLAAVGDTYASGALPQHKVVVVEVATGQTVRELECHSNYVNQLLFSPDGKRLYTGVNPHNSGGFGRSSNALFVWDLKTGKRLKEMQTSLWDLAPDGKSLAVVENWVDIDPGFRGEKAKPSTFTLQVLDTTTWKEVGRLAEKNAVLTTLRFSPDGKTLALSVPVGSIRLYSWQARKETLRFEATKLDEATQKLWGPGQVPFLEFSPDGTMLATITDLLPEHHDLARKIDLWDLTTGKRIRSLEGAKGRPVLLAFTPRGNQLALVTTPGNFRLLDFTSGKTLKEFTHPGRTDLAVTLYRHGLTPEQAPQGPPLLQRLWNLASAGDLQSGQMPDNPQSLALAPDDRTLAVGGNKGTIHLVDILTGRELRQFSDGRKVPLTGLIFLEAGKVLCSQHWTGEFRFWDPQTGKPLPQRLGPSAGMQRSLVVSADGKLAAGVTHGSWVTLWNNLADKKPKQVRFKGSSRSIQFTPDGKKLLAGTFEGPVQVIDVASAKVVGTIGTADISSFGVSPDGRTVATWGHTPSPKWVWDEKVRLWDMSGEQRGTLPVKPSAFNGLHFTPDGRGLFVEQNGGLGLWEVSSRKLRAFIQGQGPIAVSSKGRLVVCKGSDCLLVWDLTGRNNGGKLETARLTAAETRKLWADLQAEDGLAYAAIWRLAGVPGQSVPFLETQIAANPPGHVTALRVVEVLEQCGTADARRLLQRLTGRDHPQFAEAARAALGRLKE